jgi:6-pyruvoyltetrahydropterin/6-carboxytetrahydropterin synthase
MRHGGACSNPHGHRYQVHATCEAGIVDDPDDPAYGMVIDFGDLKTILMEHVHDVLDHGFIVEERDLTMRDALNCDPTWKVIVVESTPTAENLATWIAVQLDDHLPTGLNVVEVTVYETPTSAATWTNSEW